MSSEPDDNVFDPNGWNQVDCTSYADVLLDLSRSLRAHDFSSFVGQISFVMDANNLTFEEETNQRSIERSSDVVMGLAYMVLQLLEGSENPDLAADQLADSLEEGAKEMPPTLQVPDLAHVSFEVSIEGEHCVTMSLDEFVERMDFTLEDFAALTRDLSLLDNCEDVDDIFMQIDEGES